MGPIVPGQEVFLNYYEAMLYTSGMSKLSKRKGPTPRRPRRLPTIFVGYVFPRSPGLVHEAWFRSMMHLFAGGSGKVLLNPVGIGTGPLLSRARNQLVQTFLEGDLDYFLWTDTDIEFRYEDLAVLMQSDKDIAGSVYFALDSEGQPTVAHLQETEDTPGTYAAVSISDCYGDDNSPKEPFVVSGLGCGFTLIKREVMHALAESHGGTARLWPYAETGEEEGYGEDLTFGLRAAELGFESWLVPASRVGHIKEIVI